MNIEQFIRGYTSDVVHMSLGTCANGKPWVCEVHFTYDDELNIYFMSLPATRHGQEIAANSNVSGNIVRQHAKGEKPSGVYFEGTAEKLVETGEDSFVHKLYVERLGFHPLLAKMVEADGPRFYKITISDFYVFDATGTLGPPQKYHLEWRK